MGLPPLLPAGGYTDRTTRFITLEERLADHVTAPTPRVTPGRTTRESFVTALPPPVPPYEAAAEEQKDDVHPLHRVGASSSLQASVDTVDALTRPVPRTRGVEDSNYTHGDAQDVVASIQRAANFARYPVEVEEMCGGGDVNYDLPSAAVFDWELFIEGLGDEFPPTAMDDIPASIRALFVAHAKKVDNALADVRQELRRGETRQDDLTVELRTHRLQTFKTVQNDTAALKVETTTLKQQLARMTKEAQTREENVAKLIATLTKMQEDHVCFGKDLQDIGRKMDTAVPTTHASTSPTPPAGSPNNTIAGVPVGVRMMITEA